MIDYDATLQIYFAENIKYLEKLQRKAKDKIIAGRIVAAIDMVRRIAANPTKYADYKVRVKEGMENGTLANAFIPAGTDNNSALLSFWAILNSMGDLNSQLDYRREQAQKKLLAALKTIKYKNSTNAFKDFVFAFRSGESFAVQAAKQKKQYTI